MGERWLGEAETERGMALPYAIVPATIDGISTAPSG
jgi:hypothetical protein